MDTLIGRRIYRGPLRHGDKWNFRCAKVNGAARAGDCYASQIYVCSRGIL